MAYRESLEKFTAAAKACNIDYELHVPSSREDKDLLNKLFSGDLSESISREGYVGGVEIPWTAEEFSLYRFDELEARQTGYRTDGRTGAVSPGWDQNKYVIGDWTGNPISIDRSGAIFYSRHGMGQWSYVRIAKDLPTFITILGRWMEFFVAENKKNILNDDFEVGGEHLASIRARVLSGLDDEEKRGFVKFLIG